jgi:hypothetical protein
METCIAIDRRHPCNPHNHRNRRTPRHQQAQLNLSPPTSPSRPSPVAIDGSRLASFAPNFRSSDTRARLASFAPNWGRAAAPRLPGPGKVCRQEMASFAPNWGRLRKNEPTKLLLRRHYANPAGSRIGFVRAVRRRPSRRMGDLPRGKSANRDWVRSRAFPIDRHGRSHSGDRPDWVRSRAFRRRASRLPSASGLPRSHRGARIPVDRNRLMLGSGERGRSLIGRASPHERTGPARRMPLMGRSSLQSLPRNPA